MLWYDCTEADDGPGNGCPPNGVPLAVEVLPLDALDDRSDEAEPEPLIVDGFRERERFLVLGGGEERLSDVVV